MWGAISNGTASAGDVAGVNRESWKKEENKRVVWKTLITVGDIRWHFLNQAKKSQRAPFETQGQTNERKRSHEVQEVDKQ